MRNAAYNNTLVDVQNNASHGDQLQDSRGKAAATFRFEKAYTVHPSFGTRGNLENKTIAKKVFACNLILTENHDRLEHAKPQSTSNFGGPRDSTA